MSKCFTLATSQSSWDIILRNRPTSFQKTATITTRFSDHVKMTLATFRLSYTRKTLQNFIYRNYKILITKIF